MELVLATHNQGKVVELRAMLEGLTVRLSSVIDYHYPRIPEIVEDGETFLDNARKKAHTVAEATGRLALADDSGLVVEALGGEPGVHSARYAGRQGNYRANNEKLLAEMAEVPDGKRQAAFVCVMVLAEPDGEEWVVEGRCEGEILRDYRGEGGFGFDPLFFVPGEKATMAELSIERKNQISHRGQALAKMKQIIVGMAKKHRG
jgi:XTP/dITP diphosphohydrolase